MSTTATQKDAFSGLITDYFVNHVCTHLSDKLKENQVDISAETICGWFNVPYAPKSPAYGFPPSANIGTQTPVMPSYFQNTGATPAKKGRRKTKVDPNGPKCEYVFQRGKVEKRGTTCGAPVAGTDEPGSDRFCKACLKKKTVQKLIGGDDEGVKKVQPTNLPSGMIEVQDTQEEESSRTINAVPVEGRPNVFYDLDHGYILETMADGTLVVLAMRENDGNERPLTSDEKQQAQILGMSLISTPQSSPAPVQTPVQSVPAPMNIPAPAPVPQVPQVPNFTAPTGQSYSVPSNQP